MMKPYESYKVTDISWLGEIPSHWDIRKIGELFIERRSKVSDKDFAPLSVSKNGIVPQLSNAAKSNDGDNRKLVCSGDFVINSRSDRKGSSGVSTLTGSVSLINIALEPRQHHNGRYMHYLLKSNDFVEEYYRNGRGIVADLWTTRYSEMKTITLGIPLRTEQDQIVRYLDWQTTKINTLVQTKKRQIELLKEQKQAIINQAVTKGLDDIVAMKDSGVEWLGEVPAHWEVTRCKYLFKERIERSQTGDEQHLSMSQKFGLIPVENLTERRMLSESYIGGKLCYCNDLVLNRLKAHLGVFSLSKYNGVISPDYTVLKIDETKILPSIAELVLKCEPCRRELRIRVRGVVEGFWRLYTDDFNTISLPLPPLSEQQAIVTYLEEKTSLIDKAIAVIEKEIELVTEYKTSLISSVITGKVDVRGVVVPEFETVENTPERKEDEDELEVE